MKYLIANLAYGHTYGMLFLNNHLASLLDPSNLPSLTEYEVHYMIFTDHQSLPYLQGHPNVIELRKYANVEFKTFTLKDGASGFDERYSIQTVTFQSSAKAAKEMDAIFSYWAADMVFAQGFFKCLEHMKDHDAVLSVPMRAAAEPLGPHLSKTHSANELFRLAYANLHPLWVASHWDAPLFSKMPYTILWNTGKGLVARSFSVSPLIMRSSEKLITYNKVPDSEVLALFDNPYWARDWTEVPTIGVEPLFCFYPPWKNSRADVGEIREWLKHLKPHQIKNFEKQFYYPSKDEAGKVDTAEVAMAILEEPL